MEKIIKIMRNVLIVLGVVGITLNINYEQAFAVTEEEYINILDSINQKYNDKDIDVLDGIAIGVNEVLNLEEYIKIYTNEEIKNIETQNDRIISIDKNSIKGISEGSEFICVETSSDIKVIEILVSDSSYMQKNIIKEKNRNYYKVFLDPGHGGSDPGSLGNGLRESDLNLIISNKIKAKLESKGVNVAMSRSADNYVGLSERATIANNSDVDVFVSIHQNSFTSSSANGVETFYHRDKESHKPLSDKIQKNLINNTGAVNRGVKNSNLAVLRESNMPSSLVECGFISNPNEANKLKQDYYQEKIASAVADGIYSYLIENVALKPNNDKFNDISGHWGKDVIEKFAEKGFVGGYPDGSFKPNNAVNRAEFIKLVNCVFGFVEQAEEFFIDVSPEYWYYGEVKKAVKAGYISTAYSTFRPNDYISREEAATIVTNIKNNKDSDLDKLNRYADAYKVSDWAKTSVEGAIEANYMGKGSNLFRPLDNVTRAEAVALLDPLLK